MHEATSVTSQNGRWQAMNNLADDMTEAEVLAALSRLKTLALHENEAALGALLRRWAILNPLAAVGYSKDLNGRDRVTAMSAAIATWSEHDLKAADAWVQALPRGPLHDAGIEALACALTARDPDRAIGLAQTLPPNAANQAIGFIFSALALQDPAAAAARAVSLTNIGTRSMAVRQAASAWTASNAEAALSWANSLPDTASRDLALQAIVPTWAEKEPQQAAEFAMKSMQGWRQQSSLAGVLRTWLDIDSDQALPWMENLPDDAFKTSLLDSTLRLVGPRSPDLGAKIIAMMPPNETQDTALNNFVKTWSYYDARSVEEWARAQTDEHIGHVVWPALVQGLAASNPTNALEIAGSIPDERGRRTATTLALDTWTESEPAKAAAWAEEHSDYDKDLQLIAYRWSSTDPKSTADWLRSLPADDRRDTAVEGMLWSLTTRDLPRAAESVSLIGDKEKRIEQYEYILPTWVDQDPVLARKWIRNAVLPAELRDKLLNPTLPAALR
jgi:hypothetical protein